MLEKTDIGEYRATCVGNRVVVTDAGKINVELDFKFPTGDTATKTLYSSSDKSIEVMVRALSALGFKLKSPAYPDGNTLEGLPENALSGEEAMVVVDDNEFPKGSGRIRKQIAWINRAKRKPTASDFKMFGEAIAKAKLKREDEVVLTDKEDEFA